MVKSAFLYESPNMGKLSLLEQIQADYTEEVNRFIGLIDGQPGMLPVIVMRSKTSPDSRAFEKANRSGLLTSAYSQSAFDMAADHLSNRMDEIRHELYGILPCVFTQSKALFHMALMRKSVSEMLEWADSMMQNGGSDFYGKLKDELSSMKPGEFGALTDEFNTMYECVQSGHKLPYVSHSQVRLVSTLFSLEEAGIDAPYVISITDPAHKGKHIEVPLYCSGDAMRRLKQYGKCGSVDFTIRRDGTIRVAVAFRKRLHEPRVSEYRGVDIGITDMLYTSDGQSFGTFAACEAFYKETVEPSFAGMNSIRNRKRAIRLFLRKHRGTLPQAVVDTLRQKMDRLDTMLRKMKAPCHKRNRYDGMQAHGIREAVGNYIASLNGDKGICTVLEFLDITEFNHASRRRNQQLSNFARGLLSKKLMEELNWHGYSFVQVEPAYTSQTCPVCGNRDHANRTGKRFSCTCCGHTDDADHVGAVNIASRAGDDEIGDVFVSLRYRQEERHAAVRRILDTRHDTWWSEYMAGYGI